MSKVIKIFTSLFLMIVFTITLTSCSGDITGTLKLDTTDLENKTFLKDGIGEVKLLRATDGDTANFSDATATITLRFFSVDTPESTGDVDKWGLAASQYTKEKLENATSIVIESNSATPEKDTYGRYLGYVWYKSSDDAEYRNLCLELVENGYSKNTSKASGKYLEYFNKAEAAAEKNKLHIWSDEDDPLYSGTPLDTDLKYINEHKDELYYKMVMFDGYISSIDGDYVTVTQQIDGTDYSFTVYLHNTSATFLSVQGNLVKIVGTVQEYNGEYQVSGIRYNLLEGENSALITQGYYLTFGYSVNSGRPRYSFENILISNVKEEGNNYVFEGTTARLRQDEVVNVTFTVPKTETINVNDYIGKNVKCFGFNENGTSSDDLEINFVVRDLSDMSIA